MIRDRKVVAKLFDMVGPRYKDRPGGYTRIIKLGVRLGDNAPLSQIELVEEELVKRSSVKPAAAPVKKARAKAKVEEAPAVTEEA